MQNFKRYQSLLENTLARQDFDHEPKELYQPIAYILSLGGKRLRPALTLAGCDLFEGEITDALMPALGIEVFHNFSLVHDDIMDKAEVRRGKKTIHEKWGTNTAILSGDAMLVQAYKYMAKVDQSILPQILKSFSKTALQICEGQQMDMNFENQTKVSEADYLEMICLKTAVLLGCALKIGALVGKASEKKANSLYSFGVNAGLAFQVQDDLLDAFGDPDKFGKKVGGDILQDKKTLLMIYSKTLDLEGWQALSAKNLSESEKVQAWQQFFVASGAKAKAEAKRDALLAESHEALELAAGTNQPVHAQLKEFATWLAHRDH